MKNKNMFGARDKTFPYLNQWDSFVGVSEELNIKIGVGCWLSSFMVNMGGSGSLRLKKKQPLEFQQIYYTAKRVPHLTCCCFFEVDI